MTKQQEIAALDKFIAQLGTDSYLGPWLRDNRVAIVADIKNDLPVEVLMPNAARREAQDIVNAARREGESLRKAAEDAAANLRAATQRQCDQQRQIVADVIRRHAEEAARALRVL
jgi:lambda repressor-like predicted transcriptional regulator